MFCFKSNCNGNSSPVSEYNNESLMEDDAPGSGSSNRNNSENHTSENVPINRCLLRASETRSSRKNSSERNYVSRFIITVVSLIFLIDVLLICYDKISFLKTRSQEAAPVSRPWMAALLMDGQLFCGGVLISDRHVLTTARCVGACERGNGTIIVRLVGHDNVTGEEGHKYYAVKEAKGHELFNCDTSEHDIAVLALKENVPDSVQRAILPPAGALYSVEDAIVTGFDSADSKTLTETSVVVWDNQDCSDAFAQTINDPIYGTFLCANVKYWENAIIQEFTGGPLHRRTSSNNTELIGLVSWQISSDKFQYPVVYTRVNKYLHWIYRTLEITSPTPELSLPTSCKDIPVIVGKYENLFRLSVKTPIAPVGWPWMAALLKDGRQCCGGVLITDHHVLTAAHCLEVHCISLGVHGANTVRLVEYDNVTNEDRHTNYEVKDARPHKQFNSSTGEHDIAILVLGENVPDSVQRATLPQAGLLHGCEIAIVTGFDKTDSKTLKEIPVVVWDNQDCSDKHPKEYHIFDSFLCAGTTNGENSVIKGYSGGPIHVHTFSGNWEVIGLVSWKLGSDKDQYPVVFTRVNKYLPWIKSSINSKASSLSPRRLFRLSKFPFLT